MHKSFPFTVAANIWSFLLSSTMGRIAWLVIICPFMMHYKYIKDENMGRPFVAVVGVKSHYSKETEIKPNLES